MVHIIRTSDRNTFRKCRQQWDFTSPIRRNLEPIRTDTNLTFGTAIHRGLEIYYEPTRWETRSPELRTKVAIMAFVEEWRNHRHPDMSPDQLEEYDALTQLGISMLKYYGKWAQHRDAFTPVAVELDFEVPVRVPQYIYAVRSPFTFDDYRKLYYEGYRVVYQGRIDLLLRDNETERLWIVDHKSTSRLDDRNAHLDIDPQVGSYAWAVEQLYDEKVAGVIYNQLLKSAPNPPRVLNSGKLSKDKSQNTTYELYMAAIEARGLNPNDYTEFLEHLQDNPREYVRRIPLHRSPAEIERQGELIFMEATDMLNTPSIYPNPHFMECNRCAFRAPCLVNQEKGDVEFALNDTRLYKERE